MKEKTLGELREPIERAVLMSMAMTGTFVRYDPVTEKRSLGPYYSHDEYDEAMAALNELCRRARLVQEAGVSGTSGSPG